MVDKLGKQWFNVEFVYFGILWISSCDWKYPRTVELCVEISSKKLLNSIINSTSAT